MYRIENPIPGSVKYITRDGEFKNRKMRYVQTLLGKKVSPEEVKKVYEESRMPEEHAKELEKMRKEIEKDVEEQAHRLNREEEMVKSTKKD